MSTCESTSSPAAQEAPAATDDEIFNAGTQREATSGGTAAVVGCDPSLGDRPRPAFVEARRPLPADPTPIVVDKVKKALQEGVASLRLCLKEVSELQLHHLRKELPSLMHFCAREGDAACFLLMLLEYRLPTTVEGPGDMGYPVHEACAAGNTEVARLMMTYTADEMCYHKATKYSGKYPLHLAAENSHIDIVRALLEGPVEGVSGGSGCGITVDCRDRKHRTPLHLAADNHHFGVVRYLVERHGASIFAVSGEMRVPWMGAIEAAHFPLIRILSGGDGACLSSSSLDDAPSAGAAATTMGDPTKMMKSSYQSQLYSTPLQYAVLEKRLSDEKTLEVVQFLVQEMKEDPNVTTGTRLTLVDLCHKRLKTNTAEWLGRAVTVERKGSAPTTQIPPF